MIFRARNQKLCVFIRKHIQLQKIKVSSGFVGPTFERECGFEGWAWLRLSSDSDLNFRILLTLLLSVSRSSCS